jgi:uncharacterized coiled-coil protein SlyX
VLHQLTAFTSQSHKRIQTFTARIEEVERKAEEFEKVVERLNAAIVNLSSDVDQVDEYSSDDFIDDENGDESEVQVRSETQVRIDAMLKEYRERIVEVRTWIRSEVERLKKSLEQLVDDMSVSL